MSVVKWTAALLWLGAALASPSLGAETKAPASLRAAPASAPAMPALAKTKKKSVWDKLPKTRSGQIVLLEAGAEPRRALRYRFPEGAGGKVKITTRSELAVEAGGQREEAGFVPRLEMLAELKVGKPPLAGEFAIHVLGKRPKITNLGSLPAPLRKELEAALGQVPELKGVSVVTDRGVQKRLTFEATKGKSAEVQQILQGLQANLGGMSAPLPEEPVGVGAKWLVNNSVTQAGMTLTQLAVYELISLEGNVGRALIEIRQQAPKGRLQVPGMPADVKTELVRMSSKGEGETYFNLDNPAPKGRVKTSAKITMKSTRGAQSQEVTLRIKGLLRFRPN